MKPILLRRAAVAMALVASAPAMGKTDPLGNVTDLPADLEHKVEALAASLREDGYEVARGYAKQFPVEQCTFPIHVLGNCLGNNPTSPYVIPVVPHWRDEYVDPHMHLVLGPVHRGYESTYRLAKREALVLLVQVPGPAAYFGVQSYVFTRKATINKASELYRGILAVMPDMVDLLFATAPDPSRVVLFSSIGNSNNNVVMSQNQTFWGEQRFIIITPDPEMTSVITSALKHAANVGADQVFFEPVATDLAKLGLDTDADDFATFVRYAMPEDETAAEAWWKAPTIGVLRVRDTRPAPVDKVFYTLKDAEYESRSFEPEQWLTDSLTQLVDAVKSDLGPAPSVCPFVNPYLPPIELIGQRCLERAEDPNSSPMNCLGDTQDTDTYHTSYEFLIDPPGKTVAVVGTLSTETGNATYVSLSINRFSVLEGVQNISNVQLTGSADGFGGVTNKDRLYAFYLSRHCPTNLKAKCYEISEKLVPSGETIKIMQRAYIKPGTRRGADVSTPGTLLLPVLISPDANVCPSRP